jgi:hypothetical protein
MKNEVVRTWTGSSCLIGGKSERSEPITKLARANTCSTEHVTGGFVEAGVLLDAMQRP